MTSTKASVLLFTNIYISILFMLSWWYFLLVSAPKYLSIFRHRVHKGPDENSIFYHESNNVQNQDPSATWRLIASRRILRVHRSLRQNRWKKEQSQDRNAKKKQVAGKVYIYICMHATSFTTQPSEINELSFAGDIWLTVSVRTARARKRCSLKFYAIVHRSLRSAK